MAKIRYFPPECAPTVAEIASWTGAQLAPGTDGSVQIRDVAPLDGGGPGDLTFLDNPKYALLFETTRASAAFVSVRHAAKTPAGCVALISPQPYRAMAVAMGRMFTSAMRPQPILPLAGVSEYARVHPQAKLENGVSVDPGAVIGAGARIGAGTTIGANAVIAAQVCIGRDCSIGAGAVVSCALIGDRVILHPGVCIGQDGFGFAMGPQGHLKAPQIGRVIIQDDVEIGANSTVDRGANRDTMIGEGAKIDNLVQIGHNVIVGRHCVLCSQAGISGSTVLEDFVVLGGKAGLAGHLHVGMGAQIAAAAGLMHDVPAGERWAGAPAQRARDFFKEVAMVKKLAKGRGSEAGEG